MTSVAKENMFLLDGIQTRRVVDPTPEEVVEAVSCPACNVGVGVACIDPGGLTHSQRLFYFERVEEEAFGLHDEQEMRRLIVESRESGNWVSCMSKACGVCCVCAPGERTP